MKVRLNLQWSPHLYQKNVAQRKHFQQQRSADRYDPSRLPLLFLKLIISSKIVFYNNIVSRDETLTQQLCVTPNNIKEE